MPNLDEIDVLTERDDEAARWAAEREFDLRFRAYELAKLGVIGMIGKTTRAMERFAETMRGIR